MTDTRSDGAIVVGIDGSQAAIHAAKWAIDEAVARDAPLRLVHVMRPESAEPSTDVLPLGVEYGETVLRQADAAVGATGSVVKVETAIIRGDPAAALLAESQDAELMCVGSSGVDAVAKCLLGSKAAALAEGAHCPVAIIRDHGDEPGSSPSWIAVTVRASTDAEEVVIAALDEARLRHAPMLAVGLWQRDFGATPYDELDFLVESWRQRYPDVRVHPIATHTGLTQFLDDEGNTIDFVVVGVEDADQVAHIVGPHSHPIFGHHQCSVLVVRH